MNWLRSLLVMLAVLPLNSEPAQIMYYNFFGEYLAESSFQIDIDVASASLRQIKETLEELRTNSRSVHQNIASDLVIIGYGARGYPHEFFAATTFVDYEVPLGMVFGEQPERRPDSKWYIYYVDSSLSGYVRDRKDHHWSSPFRWLAQIGLQDLHYFGPFLFPTRHFYPKFRLVKLNDE